MQIKPTCRLVSNSPYSGSKLLAVKISSLIKSKRQSSETRPVFGVGGVSTGENVASGLLVQKPQHSLVFYLLRRETMTTINQQLMGKCTQKRSFKKGTEGSIINLIIKPNLSLLCAAGLTKL